MVKVVKGGEGKRRLARRVNGGIANPEIKVLRDWLESDGRGKILGNGFKSKCRTTKPEG